MIKLPIGLNIGNYINWLMRTLDSLSKKLVEIIKKSNEPLETVEVTNILKSDTRSKILYRLVNLRGDGLIKGKQVGSGKQTWIWWKP